MLRMIDRIKGNAEATISQNVTFQVTIAHRHGPSGMGIRKDLAAVEGTVRTRFLYEAPQK